MKFVEYRGCLRVIPRSTSGGHFPVDSLALTPDRPSNGRGPSDDESVQASLDTPLCLRGAHLPIGSPIAGPGQIDILRRARRTAFETLLRRTTPRQPREVMSRRAQKYVQLLCYAKSNSKQKAQIITILRVKIDMFAHTLYTLELELA